MTNKKQFAGLFRRDLLKMTAGLVLAAGGNLILQRNVSAAETISKINADQALEVLMAGNQRYASQKLTHPHQTRERLVEVSKGQHPLAIVLGCADSRVTPEILFDQGIGDLFDIRVAGNIVDDAVIGSVEYAVAELGVPLLIVLGHERCGAVTAALESGEVLGHVSSLVKAIKLAVESVKDQSGDRLDNAVRANVKMVVEQLKGSQPLLANFVQEGRLKVVGGRYDLDSGKVEIIA